MADRSALCFLAYVLVSVVKEQGTNLVVLLNKHPQCYRSALIDVKPLQLDR